MYDNVCVYERNRERVCVAVENVYLSNTLAYSRHGAKFGPKSQLTQTPGVNVTKLFSFVVDDKA